MPFRIPLILALAALSIGGAASTRAQASSADAKSFRVSVSVSPFAELPFAAGITYTDGQITAANPVELQQLFAAHGANEVYARISTTANYRVGAGDHSMQRGIARARLARQLDLPFNPELGLFNIYGDVRCQPPPDFSDYPEIKLPGPWASLTIEQMTSALRLYGALAAKQILATGVKVRIWDLGNEVEFGTAGVAVQPLPEACDDTAGGPGWYRAPDRIDPQIGQMSPARLMNLPEPQRLAWLEAHLWPYEAKLLAAVAAGICSVDPAARFSTHASGITAVIPAQAVAFYQAMRDGGFAVDEIGLSYYPTSSAVPPDRWDAFQRTATALHQKFGRPVFVTEFGYPARKMSGIFPWNDMVQGYPESAEGQANFLRDLVSWGVRTGVLSGIRPWAPDLATPGWGPMSFFELHGKTATARPSLDAIRDGLRAAQSQ